MTDPAPRPDADGGPRRGRGVSRRVVAVAAAIPLVAVAVALAISSGGGVVPASTPTASQPAGIASPAFTDLPMVTVPPTPSAPAGTSPSSAAATSTAGSPAPTASPAAEGIRATRIRIARLRIDLAIVEGDGIDAPIGKAAHYPGSAWPGGGSNIYIYGHARAGMFINLWDARQGDSIELGLVDGTTKTYVVTKVLPKVPWDAVQYLAPTSTERLTVQTSTSYYPTAPRFVVIAVPAP